MLEATGWPLARGLEPAAVQNYLADTAERVYLAG